MRPGALLNATILLIEVPASDPPSPIVVEAASSIIFAAHQTESRGERTIRNLCQYDL